MAKFASAVAVLFAASAVWAGAAFDAHGKFSFRFEGETVFGADNLILGLRSDGAPIQWVNEDSVPFVAEKPDCGRIERAYVGSGPIAAIRKSIRDLPSGES